MEAQGKISFENGKLVVPDRPTIPYIEGDGIGPDIWAAAVRVFNRSVQLCWKGERRIRWKELLAGEKAFKQIGEWLPQDTVEAFRTFRVGIKGPLTTPIGAGIRSLNVALRQTLDLYARKSVHSYDLGACNRQVHWDGHPGLGDPDRDGDWKLRLLGWCIQGIFPG